MQNNQVVSRMSATRATAITFGVLAGVAGMEHGFFEMLQGSVAPGGVVIEAIGPAQRFWEYGTEFAMTVVPNFLLTGILAMIVGFGIIVWSIAFVQTRYGPHVLAILAVMLLLCGGGFAPLFGAVLAIVAASRIDKPLTWWSVRITGDTRRFLARSWKGSLIVVAVLYSTCIVSGIFGWPLLLLFGPETVTAVLLMAGLAVLVLMLYIVPAAFAHDIQKRTEFSATLAREGALPSL